MKLSIVTTLYNSSRYIEEFYRRITCAARNITDDYEIILVNDGSQDDSLEKVVEIFEQDSKIKLIDLSRNFGHHLAIMTGLSLAKGDYIFFIDSDLEEEPELLEPFWTEMNQYKDVDVIYGVQKRRKGELFEKFSGWCFYKFFNMISTYKLPQNVSLVRLMTRRFVRNLVKHREVHPAVAGLSLLTGFRQKEYIFNKNHKGTTEYNLRRKIAMFVDFVTSFSARPLVFIFYFGFLILLITILFAFIIVSRKIFLGVTISGWTSLILSVWFFGGLIVFSIGVIGIYLSKIFEQSKNRPHTIIREVYSQEEEL